MLCIVGSLVNGSYLLWQSRGQWQTDTAPRETAADELPDYNDRLFGFSKTGENIVVVMMDAFTGTHMERILQAEPELKRDLDGFVWYPDTLAAGPSTNTGIASVLCGYDCTPLAINALKGLWFHESNAAKSDEKVPQPQQKAARRRDRRERLHL